MTELQALFPCTHRDDPCLLRPIVRGSRTRFCVSGPFPDTLPNLTTPDPDDVTATTIETLLNGVVVAFSDVYGNPGGLDVGAWDSPLRTFPLYPPEAE